jgi:heat shock protein HtpX
MLTISIVLNLLGVKPYLSQNGIDYNALMIFCLAWGFGGALISLAISRMSAKWMMGVKVLQPGSAGQYEDLVQMVHNLSRGAGLSTMPEVGIYDSPEVNAFATGPTKNRSLVAFSTGLLRQMSKKEIEGVAAHEVAHIQNGDMVTMTLIQGVVNAFVMFFARVIAFAISKNVREENQAIVHFITVLVLDIVLGILGSIIVMWFSRQREFKADAGAAALAGSGSMIAALQSLQRTYGKRLEQQDEHASLATMKISGKQGGLLALLSSHPSLEERIARLQA